MMRLLLGRAGSGKTTLCLQEMEAELQRGQDGPALIYLVPEQAAFQAEYALASLPGLGGTMGAQVLSFRRLAWRVLQETGGGRRLFIDDTGKGMVLRKVLERHKSSLEIFRHAGEKPGLMHDLVHLYNELRRARISVYQLKESWSKQKDKQGGGGLLGKKLQEVSLIMEEAEEELSSHYVDAEDTLLLLALKMPQSHFVRDALVWVDGFYGFTELEFLVLESLLRQVGEMTVTLCLERDYAPGETVDELDPFYNSASTCIQLQHMAANCGIATVKSVLSPKAKGIALPRFQNNLPLAHLEQHLHKYPVVPFTNAATAAEPSSSSSSSAPSLPLKLVAASGRRSEVEAVAREIITLVRDKHYRFREMGVVAHNLEQYEDLIVPVFQDYDIPFFLDQKRNVLHHPLVEFIRSALEVVTGNWQPDAVFRCIKSGFLFPVLPEGEQRQRWRDRAAMLENYVLAFGIRGMHWRGESPWTFTKRDTLETGDSSPSPNEAAFLKRIDRARRHFSEPLLRFQEEFRAAVLVKERVSALYRLLETVSAAKHMEFAAAQYQNQGEPEKSREQEQVYQGILELMDQLVEIMGTENVNASFFNRLIDGGLSALRLGLVPPSLDQVLVGNLERTRAGNLRALFLLGVNDGVLPSRPGGEAIFSERERETLEAQGFRLSPGPQRRLLDEEFLIYIALTRASERLWVSYSLADAEGRALLPSLLVNRLQELFPALAEEVPVGEGEDGYSDAAAAVPDAEIDGHAVLPLINHPRQTLSRLALQLGRWKEGAPLHPLWWEVYNWFVLSSGRQEGMGRLLEGLFYSNVETTLTAQTSRKLYGAPLRASASRLERFRFCPFAHFSGYGLGLKERAQHRLEAPDTGRFFHVALRNVACVLQEQKRHWSDCSSDELMQLVSTEVNKLLPRVQQEILLSSRRYNHLAKKMEETVGRAVLYLAEHDRRSVFKPLGVEIGFGKDAELPPLLLTLPDGSPVEVTGRIDRVDGALTDTDNFYLRVIDYKSGATDLKMVEVLHGLSLQLLLYLDAVLTNAPLLLEPYGCPGATVLPAGIFYFRVFDPLLRSSGPLAPEELEQELLKLFKLKGKILADPAVVHLMDTELHYGYSKVVPAGLSKQGELYRVKSLLTAGEFEQLRSHVRLLTLETAAKILKGSMEISPFKMGRKKACTFCDYKAVCQFDLMLEENNFRLLSSGVELPAQNQGPKKQW